MVAVRGIALASSDTAPSTITIKPAAGPLIVNWALRKNETSMPPTMAVSSPEIGGTPLAMEMPRHNGKAIRKTRKPEMISDFILFSAIR
jgi:hypothetical protein